MGINIKRADMNSRNTMTQYNTISIFLMRKWALPLWDTNISRLFTHQHMSRVKCPIILGQYLYYSATHSSILDVFTTIIVGEYWSDKKQIVKKQEWTFNGFISRFHWNEWIFAVQFKLDITWYLLQLQNAANKVEVGDILFWHLVWHGRLV